jgi:hypothetical protein
MPHSKDDNGELDSELKAFRYKIKIKNCKSDYNNDDYSNSFL